MKWLGPTLRVLGWTALIGFGATNFATIGTVELAKRLGGIPLEVLIDFLSGSITKWLKKEPGMGGLEFRAFHECVFESAHRATESGAIPRALELPNQIKSQAKQAGEAWNAILIELHGVSEFGSLLGGRNEPHQSDIEEILGKLYPMLKGAVLSMIAAEVFISFERKFIELLSREDSQQLYRQRLLSAVLEMHRDMMFKLDAIHIDVKEGRSEIREIRDLLVEKFAIDVNASDSRQRAITLYNEAMEIINGRVEGDAVERLELALTLDPSFFDALVAKGTALSMQGYHHEALNDLDRALLIQVGDPRALWIRSFIRGSLNDKVGALEDARQAVIREPNTPGYHVRLGNSLFVMEKTDEARQSFARALELDPGYADALVGLSKVTDDAETKLSLLDRAISIEPELGIAHSERGSALALLGRTEEAVAAWNRAIQIDPKQDRAWSELSNLASKEGNFKEAERLLRCALDAQPNSPIAFAYLGTLKLMTEEFEEAIYPLTMAIVNGGLAEAYWARGWAYEMTNRPQQALNDFDKSIELNSNRVEAFRHRGNVKLNLGWLNEALTDFNKSYELDSSRGSTLMQRSKCKVALGDFEGAIADCNIALQLEPENCEFLFQRARANEAADRKEDALSDYRRLTQLIEDGGVWNNYGALLASMDRWAEALDAYDRGISAGSTLTSLRPNRAVALVKLGRTDEAVAELESAIKADALLGKRLLESDGYDILKENPAIRAVLG